MYYYTLNVSYVLIQCNSVRKCLECEHCKSLNLLRIIIMAFKKSARITFIT